MFIWLESQITNHALWKLLKAGSHLGTPKCRRTSAAHLGMPKWKGNWASLCFLGRFPSLSDTSLGDAQCWWP